MYLRYLVLGWVLYTTVATGKLIFEKYDPHFALFNFWTGEVAISGLIVLGLIIVASFFVERSFCKYACPLGAVLGIFNLIRIFKIKRNTETCVNCNLCTKNCPMNIPVATSTTVRNHHCITCLECTSEQACPAENTEELSVVNMEAAS